MLNHCVTCLFFQPKFKFERRFAPSQRFPVKRNFCFCRKFNLFFRFNFFYFWFCNFGANFGSKYLFQSNSFFRFELFQFRFWFVIFRLLIFVGTVRIRIPDVLNPEMSENRNFICMVFKWPYLSKTRLFGVFFWTFWLMRFQYQTGNATKMSELFWI